MYAKFQYIMYDGTVLKAFCIGILSEDSIEKDKRFHLIRNYIEKDENYLVNNKIHTVIIYEKIKNLSQSKYKHLGLKSTYERYINAHERF